MGISEQNRRGREERREEAYKQRKWEEPESMKGREAEKS